MSSSKKSPKKIQQAQQPTPLTDQRILIPVDYQLPGRIAVDKQSEPSFAEGALNQARWKQPMEFAHSLARTVEKVFGIADNLIAVLPRVVEINGQEISPWIVMSAPGLADLDGERLAAVVTRFSEEVLGQRQLLSAAPRAALAESEEQLLGDAAKVFRETFGGQPVQRAMQVQVDREPVATLQGRWRPRPESERPVATTQTMCVRYDGRRLHSRLMFVLEQAERGGLRQHEIYYDEQEFDAVLRDLADDKNALLDLAVERTPRGKQFRLELKSLRRISAESEELLRTYGPTPDSARMPTTSG